MEKIFEFNSQETESLIWLRSKTFRFDSQGNKKFK